MKAKLFESDRFYYREFDADLDAKTIYELNSDIEVIQYTGDPPFKSEQDAYKTLKDYDHYKKYGYGRWAAIRKDDDVFVGWCGLKMNDDEILDIGYRFFKKFWGKGYATETAKASLKYGFEELNLEEIIGRAAKENIASIKVLEKLGMKYYKTAACEHISGAVYYKINKEEYAKLY